jgi:hypothetical protein
VIKKPAQSHDERGFSKHRLSYAPYLHHTLADRWLR